jgi:hypothetical protein
VRVHVLLNKEHGDTRSNTRVIHRYMPQLIHQTGVQIGARPLFRGDRTANLLARQTPSRYGNTNSINTQPCGHINRRIKRRPPPPRVNTPCEPAIAATSFTTPHMCTRLVIAAPWSRRGCGCARRRGFVDPRSGSKKP